MTSAPIRCGAMILLLCMLVGARLSVAQPRACPGEAGSDKSRGQTLYVPAYSEIPFVDETRRFQLTVTLSVRNTDATQAIRITSVRYFDAEGRLLHTYVEQPLRLGPLASTVFVVRERDTRGGAGASFLLEWRAEAPTHAPVVDAIMIGTSSNQGISFTSAGRVLTTQCP